MGIYWLFMGRYKICESRVEFTEQNGKHCECNTAKDMQEQALRRAHCGSGLNICQVAKPIEERFDGLPHRAYKCRHGVPSEKCVAALLESPLADAPQVNGDTLLISKLGTEIVALALHFSFDYATIVADSAI